MKTLTITLAAAALLLTGCGHTHKHTTCIVMPHTTRCATTIVHH